MKINIKEGARKPHTVSEVVDLSEIKDHANYSLKGIKPFTANVTFETFKEVVEVDIAAKVTVILECAYSAELFDQEIEVRDELNFNFVNPNIEAERDDTYYEAGPEIDLDPYLYALILSYIPLRAIKPGAKFPKSGEGYSVMTEAEYKKKKQTLDDKYGDLFDKLDFDD